MKCNLSLTDRMVCVIKYIRTYVLESQYIFLERLKKFMIEVTSDRKEILVPLFQGLQDSLILSCIQNYFGTAWVDDIDDPGTGRIIVGDYCFLAGEPAEAFLHGRGGEMLPWGMVIVPDSRRWHPWIEKVYGSHCKKKERYGIKKEGDIFDRKKLRGYINGLAEGYELREINCSIYHYLMSREWSVDFCKQFLNWEHFREKGMGVVVCRENEIVAGASSYTSYREGIEVEIITRADYRRRGLAVVCGSALILKALEKNKYPNWDAANMASVAVATKLGYHYDKPYEVYEIR